jgi:intein/homing endonuclease
MKKALNQYGKLIDIMESIKKDTYTCPVCKEILTRNFGEKSQFYSHPKGKGEDCELKLKLILKDDDLEELTEEEIDILKTEYYNKEFNDVHIELSDYKSNEGYYLTQEQKDIIFAKEDKIKISALAGSAKSSTLYYYAKERPFKKILYLVYNKSMKDEADKMYSRLPHVEVRTIHSLAYGFVGKFYKNKLTFNYGVVDVIKDLNLNWSNDMELATKIHKMMNEYSLSSVIEFEDIDLFDKDEKQSIVSNCKQLWELKKNYNNNTKVTHDDYLKMFQLSKKSLAHKYDIIMLDEAQDSSLLMLDILKSSDVNGIVVVGDEFQCLAEGTLISTTKGNINIKDITVGDEINVACGFSEKTTGKVESINKNKINDKLIRVTTENGNIIEGTANHMIFGKIDGYEVGEGKHYIYLMFKKNYGYRIGITSSLRKLNGKSTNGFMARINAERGDKLWIIKVCDTMDEAIYYENLYSFEYGIPQMMFTADNTKAISQGSINKIFKNIDTYSRADKLLNDFHLFKDYPHHIPQSSTGINGERLRLSFTMFGNKRISKKSGYSREKIFNLHPHELTINTTNTDYIKCTNKYITMNKKRSTSSGNEYFNGRKIHTLYDECWNTIVNIVDDMKNIGYDVEPNIKAKLTEDKFDLLPLTNVIEGMIIPIETDDGIINEKVKKVERFDYNGYVYDINVPYYRNYIANGIVVHNCIYGWRNATNIMPYFEGKEYKLTTSFRVSQNIANIANIIVKDINKVDIDMKGFNTNQQIVDNINKNEPYVCLCRTNAYIFAEVFEVINNNRHAKLFFEGGYSSYNFNNIKDFYFFSKGHKVKNPLFNKFDDFYSMIEYANEIEDYEILALNRMLFKYGSKIPQIVDGIKNNTTTKKLEANVIFSTIHRAKGQTYLQPVYISDDHFDIEKVFKKEYILHEDYFDINKYYEEMCLVYVAVSRCFGEIELSPKLKEYLLLRWKHFNNNSIKSII